MVQKHFMYFFLWMHIEVQFPLSIANGSNGFAYICYKKKHVRQLVPFLVTLYKHYADYLVKFDLINTRPLFSLFGHLF